MVQDPDGELEIRLDVRSRDAHELFSWGALYPLSGYLPKRDDWSVARRRKLADGTSWGWSWAQRTTTPPVCGSRVALREPEGQRLGHVEVHETWDEAGAVRIAGPVTLDRAPSTGGFRALRCPPPAGPGPGSRTALLVDGPIDPAHLLGALGAAERGGGPLLLMPLVGGYAGNPGPLTVAAVRSCLALRACLGSRVEVAGLPLPARPDAGERWLAARVAQRFGAGTLLVAPDRGEWLVPTCLASDDVAEVRTVVPASSSDPGLVAGLAAVRGASAPAAHRSGLVVLFTGLPSAGKSTVARCLQDRILGSTDRTVTLLDGDVVRATFSADLTFSRADRLRNLGRLAMMSAECARHGGVVLCAPIAPHEEGRALFRDGVREVANTLLVHVATPVAECARRDPKGLYAAAAAGRLSGLTGVDDPYEVPDDADVVVGQPGEDTASAVDRILGVLVARDWIRPAPWEPGTPAAPYVGVAAEREDVA